MPSEQRRRVWQNLQKQTSGGLKKSDLIMRKGRIVSKRKSLATRARSNLGAWLVSKQNAPRQVKPKKLKKVPARPKKLEPLKPGEKKSFEISVGNILQGKRRRKPKR
jgi:hypothetical protein